MPAGSRILTRIEPFCAGGIDRGALPERQPPVRTSLLGRWFSAAAPRPVAPPMLGGLFSAIDDLRP